MKKAMLLALAALCAAAWAGPALAGEFSYGGFMRFRYQGGNPGTFPFFDVGNAGVPTNPDDTATLFEYRIRQFFNYKVNDHVTTNVKFEWNSQFGDERVLGGGSGDLQFGQDSGNELQFRIKNAFVQFDLPNTPVTFVVGQQDFSTPKAIISVEDGTGVKAIVKAFGGEHTLFWQRLIRGNSIIGPTNNQTGADDADWFGFVPAFTLAGITVSPHISYVKAGSSGQLGAFADSEVWFFGVDSSGKVGPVGFTADLIFQKGSDLRVGAGNCAAAACDLFSYVLDVSATLDLGPGALTLKALYSPGDDNAADADIDSWVNVVSTDYGWSPFFHDGSDNNDFVGSVTPGVGTGGIIAFGAEFALSPVKDLTITPNVYYLMAAKDVNVVGGSPDDFYGVEAGLQANWKIWDAVTLLAQFDYLFAGDVFKPATGDAKDAWRVIIGPSISW